MNIKFTAVYLSISEIDAQLLNNPALQLSKVYTLLMKKLTSLFFCLLITGYSYAQNTRFIYEVMMKPNAADRSLIQKELAYLDIGAGGSVFYAENNYKRDSLMQRMRETRNFDRSQAAELRSNIDYRIEKNPEKQKTVFIGRIGRDQYQYEEDRKLVWQILPETAVIGTYKTQKAETEFAGRRWSAWFTQDIPLQEGPYKFSGLPGLIVKVEDNDGDYEFNLKQVKKISEPAQFVTRGNIIQLKRADFEKQNQKFRADPSSFLNQTATRGGANRGSAQADPNRRREMENRIKETLERTSNSIER